MSFKFYSAVVAVCLLMAPGIVSSQILQQMKITEVPDGELLGYVVRNTDEAILVVYSTIPQLQFESTNLLLRVDNDDAGVWILHLRPGTHLVKIQADGYATIQERFVLRRKECKEVKVSSQGEASEKVLFGTIEVSMAPGLVLVTQDGAQIAELLVGASGIFRMNLPPGRHELQFIRAGIGTYRTAVDIEVGQVLSETAAFVVGGAEQNRDAVQTGVLYVKANPVGATISVDGADAGITPLQIKKMAVGTHQIRIEKSMYQPIVKQVEIPADVVTTISETLAPDFGGLFLETFPDGADVSLDDKYVGSTPYRINMLSSGPHTISLRKAFFHDVNWPLVMVAGSRLDTVISMPPAFGSLQVTGQPNGASIYLDNQLIGQTPFQRDTLPSGSYRVRVEKEMHGTFEATVTVKDNMPAVVNVTLDKNFGTIGVSSMPSGVEVKLAGTGTVLGETPLRKDLRPGTHTIIVEDEQYGPYSTTITLGPADSVSVVAGSLTRKEGGLRVFTDPPEADIYLDGDLIGKSPQIVTRATGNCRVEARLAGYVKRIETTVIKAGVTQVLDLPLDRSGAIRLDVSPAGATVLVDGVEVSGNVASDLSPGLHAVKAVMSGYKSRQTEVQVTGGDTTQTEITLSKSGGSIRISPSGLPSGASAEVDGRSIPGLVADSIPAGTHTVSVSAPGHTTRQYSVTLREGEERTLEVKLSRSKSTPRRSTTVAFYTGLGSISLTNDSWGEASDGKLSGGLRIVYQAGGFMEVGINSALSSMEEPLYATGPDGPMWTVGKVDIRVTEFMAEVRLITPMWKTTPCVRAFVGFGYGVSAFNFNLDLPSGMITDESMSESGATTSVSYGLSIMFTPKVGLYVDARQAQAKSEGTFPIDIKYRLLHFGVVLVI